MLEEFIPVLAILILFVVFPAICLFYLHNVKTKKLATMVKLAELGGTVDLEMMKMLEPRSNPGYKDDYRVGIIWLAIGVPIVIGLMTTAEVEGIAFYLIPTFIGIAYLISGKLRLRETG